MAAAALETATKELNQQIGLTTDGSQFLTFNLGEELYGVDILRVQEIKGYTAVTKIPNTPSHIKGVLNLRGTIVPIIELRTKFSMPTIDYTAFTVTIVVVVRDKVMGLASMCIAIMLAALAYVAHRVGDPLILSCALVSLGAVLGFFVWNYPFGLVFLGDGGAYFLGFWVAELGILLVHRNEAVSPLFPLLLCAYPMFETLCTMYRRMVVRGRLVGQPDATHLHSLIYRRLMRWAVGRRDAANLLRRNSMTSPYLWLVCSMSAAPAVLSWDDSEVLGWFILAFCLSYIALYRAIVRFRTPRLLVRTGDRWVAPEAPSESA